MDPHPSLGLGGGGEAPYRGQKVNDTVRASPRGIDMRARTMRGSVAEA